jgi:hypothetical protein
MKLKYNVIKYLLLVLFIDTSSAQEICKNGRCRVDLDALDSVKVSKKSKSKSTVTKAIKKREVDEKVTIKLVVK